MIGRPPKYRSASLLFSKAMGYFDGNVNPTITGLCLHLGYSSRQAFYKLEKRKGFSYTIKTLRLMMEEHYESRLTGSHVSGPIFALKNFGWTDNQVSDNSGSIVLHVSQSSKDALEDDL